MREGWRERGRAGGSEGGLEGAKPGNWLVININNFYSALTLGDPSSKAHKNRAILHFQKQGTGERQHEDTVVIF